MKKLALLFLAILLSCNKNKIDTNPAPAPTEITTDTVVEIDNHNARNSLDYIGMYSGDLPCDTCDGLTTAIELNEGFTYILTRKSKLNKSVREEFKGSFRWNEVGNAIILQHYPNDLNTFLVGENTLVQLDKNGNLPVGTLSQKYILEKLSDGEASKTDSNANRIRTQLHDKNWNLTELNEAVVANYDTRFYLNFTSKNSFTANVGCNDISGKYKSDGSKISINDVISTKMRCANSRFENDFLEMLKNADNYVINREVLLLRNSTSVLAKFESYKK